MRGVNLYSLIALSCAVGCPASPSDSAHPAPPTQPDVGPVETVEAPPAPAPSPLPPPMSQPVDLWEHGKVARQVDAATAASQGFVVLDLGEAWVPYLFSDGVSEDGKPLPNSYRPTYLALARGEFPDDQNGERAREDKYLELYGILPTLGLMRTRMHHTSGLACVKSLDDAPLAEFDQTVLHDSNAAAYKIAADYVSLHGPVRRMLKEQHVEAAEQLDAEKLDERDQDRLKRFRKIAPEYLAVDAAQKRLACEGFFAGHGRFVRGALDGNTRDALSEFERRHRVFSWGYLGKDTLAVLRLTPLEADRRGVLRALTERAVHAAGVLEDGSTSMKGDAPRTFKGHDGLGHPIPNLVDDLEKRVVEAFGLQTPEATLAWLDALGKLPADGHKLVAFAGPDLPEYYDGDMDLTVEYDRGDVWYDFPYDANGKEVNQPVERRPNATVFTRYLGQRIPIARYGTTIGGWRSDLTDDTLMWKYKESPVGPRVWSEIVASPVWLPPDSTPPKDLLKRNRKRKPGDPKYVVNYHESGPSYASAYGLVAAYHLKYFERADGSIALGQDEGIRTHGSVDYMSIMRKHSHGCHRLHNHIAVRLMSFVLAHRPHRRKGQESLAFTKLLTYEDETYELNIKQGGYAFVLKQPLKVEVLEGRIRGKVKQPIEFPIPKYDENYRAYVTPDGHAVQVQGDKLVEIPLPVPLDAGVPNAVDPYEATTRPVALPAPQPSAVAQARVDPKSASTRVTPLAVPTRAPTVLTRPQR